MSTAPPPVPPRSKGLKSMFMSAKDRVTSSFSTLAAGAPSEEEPSFKDKMFNVKRRVTQAALQKFGSAQPSADPEYEEMKTALAAMEKLLGDSYTHANEFLNSCRALAFSCAQLGADFQTIYSDAPDLLSTATTYATACSTLDDSVRRRMDAALVAEVLEPMKGKMEAIEELKKRCLLRERYKLDYDSHDRQVQSLKSKGSADPKKLPEREAKLAQSQELLTSFSAALYRDIRMLRERRYALLLEEFRKFQVIQREFFSATAGAMSGIPAFPVTVGAAPLAVPGVPAVVAAGGGEGSAAPPAPAGGPPGAADASLPSVPQGEPSKTATAPVAAPAVTGRARALHAYAPRSGDELGLAVGDVVTVTRKEADGWWCGTKPDGTSGMFPSNFVQEM